MPSKQNHPSAPKDPYALRPFSKQSPQGCRSRWHLNAPKYPYALCPYSKQSLQGCLKTEPSQRSGRPIRAPPLFSTVSPRLPLKMAPQRFEIPIRAPPLLSTVSPRLPSKQNHPSSPKYPYALRPFSKQSPQGCPRNRTIPALQNTHTRSAPFYSLPKVALETELSQRSERPIRAPPLLSSVSPKVALERVPMQTFLDRGKWSGDRFLSLLHLPSGDQCVDSMVQAYVVGMFLERTSGAGIMEADEGQVTTVFTIQPSFHYRYSTNRLS